MEKEKNDLLLDDMDFLTDDDDIAVDEEDAEEESPSDEWDSDITPYYSESEADDADERDFSPPEENSHRDFVLSEDDFNESAGSSSADRLEFLTGDAEIIEMRSSEYRHTGMRCLLATMKLGISLDAEVLSRFPEWEKSIKESMEYYFRHTFTPHLMDEELFLPKKFLPYEAVDATSDIMKGKGSEKEIGKYLMNHEGPIVIEIDSIYENFRANAWMVKFWMIDLQNYKIFYGGKR